MRVIKIGKMAELVRICRVSIDFPTADEATAFAVSERAHGNYDPILYRNLKSGRQVWTIVRRVSEHEEHYLREWFSVRDSGRIDPYLVDCFEDRLFRV
jgi:hypothetical protein